MSPHILILGGTTEARKLAAELAALRPETQARVMGDNARKLYRL